MLPAPHSPRAPNRPSALFGGGAGTANSVMPLGPVVPSASRRRLLVGGVTVAGLLSLGLGLGLTVFARHSPPLTPVSQAPPVLTEPPAHGSMPGAAAAAAVASPAHVPASKPAPLVVPAAAPTTDAALAVPALLNEVSSVCASQDYGTKVAFLSSPAQAGKEAQHAQKLVFLLHISGNFEDRQFT
jgi:hypothetical protein